MNKKTIPKLKKTKGLYIQCNKCDAKSVTSLKSTKKCNHPIGDIVYRAIFTIPDTKSIRSKVLSTADLNEAIKQTIEFEEELKRNNYKNTKVNNLYNQRPVDLIGCISMYLDFLDDKNVYEHQKKNRSKDHINSIIRYLQRFVLSLSKESISTKGLLVKNIDDTHVAVFHKFILEDDIANRTYNRMLDTVSEFFKYLIDTKNYELKNYFSSSNIKIINYSPSLDNHLSNIR